VQTADASAPPAKVTDCKGVDPYDHYECLDAYLGTGVFERLANYYKLELGHGSAPSDPNAPASVRDGWYPPPQSTPPMPFVDWPYGGTETFGDNRPASIDSPLMVAIANTGLGEAMANAHIQTYGWIDPGANLSNESTHPGGNAPAAYLYTPNTAQLDQIVEYLERTPDTVQTDHVDWGFRASVIYGENYRYTTAYGIASWQLLKKNKVNGYDFPMMYGELWIPQIAQGMTIRVGRYIAIPDIEAQLAPNNYMYTHSLTYSYDNYTTTGVQTATALSKHVIFEAGFLVGTEAPPWHLSEKVVNPFPNLLYPNSTFKRDPGSMPTFSACVRFMIDENTTIYPCADGINKGTWGYNNLQWYGSTFYHKFNDHWHLSFEFYDMHQNNVPNLNNAYVQNLNAMYGTDGGTPFGKPYILFNNPNEAYCKNAAVLTCTAKEYGTVMYLNYSWNALNNFSIRPEFYNDMEGQRTGTKTKYVELSLGWQHWLSPQIEFRPEIGYYKSLDAPAFNGNSNAGVAPDRASLFVVASDVIFHW
jgi:hypothetical protein